MSGRLPTQPKSVFTRRTAALREALGGQAALLFAGGFRPRNYPDNVNPYRADSHFIYLTGAEIPDAAVLVDADRTVLFVPAEHEDDPLWHGPQPGPDAIAAATGVDEIRTLDTLDAAITASSPGSIPSPDPSTRGQQAAVLGRKWSGDHGQAMSTLSDADSKVVDAMVALRLCHDEAGLQAIRTAASATAEAHIAGMAVTRPGIPEHAVRAAMEHVLMARGMPTAYPAIVTVHGEILHNNAYHHTLQPGDLLLADVGGEHEGWASDVTRTWPVSGKFSPTQRALYDIVLASEKAAIDKVRPGVRYRDVHLEAAKVLAQGLVDEGILKGDPSSLVERGAHALFFPHGVGHLLGLDVHDMEDLGDRAGYAPDRSRADQFGLSYLRLDRDLESGMVVTIEPGLYFVPAILERKALCEPLERDGTLNRAALERFSDVRGIRIEDDVLCTPTGPEVLTADIPKEAGDVESRVGTGAA